MPVWRCIKGRTLNQGDLLRGIAVPEVRPNFPLQDEDGNVPLTVGTADAIVISQSCDLELRKVPFVVVAQFLTMDEFEEVNEDYRQRGKWKQVAQGRLELLHLLHGLGGETGKPRECLVIDFRSIWTLPLEYVEMFAERLGERPRLQSPYLENMSQAFGRFFMRVALPADLPREFV